MITGLLLGIWLGMTHPKPVLLQAVIDCSRIIGLPRLKTMDSYLNKTIIVDEMHAAPKFAIRTRKEFFTEYFKINKLTQ